MRIVRKVRTVQNLCKEWQRTGLEIGFVPTMGFLHRGHLKLMERARQRVGQSGKVVVSIFVNPTQFGPSEDLARYPRDFPRDTRLCREAGADLLFAPAVEDVYPSDGAGYSTFVSELKLSSMMEGKSRPTHFRGVTTVVAKLFNLVQPTVAIFGQKDFQQAAIVQQMVRDLNFPVRIVVEPTVRESDGLALSSRNTYLTPAYRRQASVLWRAIQKAQKEIRLHPSGIPAPVLRRSLAKFIGVEPDARLDYIAFFDPNTLVEQQTVNRGTHLALAVFFGKTRLIDNGRL